MKDKKLKDNLGFISDNTALYLSVVIAVTLAVSAYLGVNFAAGALTADASDYYERLRLGDIDITSAMLLSEDDLNAVRDTEGVLDAEGIYQTEASVTCPGNHIPVYIASVTERISLPELLEGRLPENSSECAVEDDILSRMGLRVGDYIGITGDGGGPVPYLLCSSFRITGRFDHADHYGRQDFTAGRRYILVTGDTFDTAELDGCYMRAAVRLDIPEGTGIFDGKYGELAAGAVSRIVSLAEVRASVRQTEIMSKYTDAIDSAQAELDEMKTQLDGARSELDQKAGEISGEEGKLEETRTELDASKEKLDQTEIRLNRTKTELDGTKTVLDGTKNRLDESASGLAGSFAEIEGKKVEIRNQIINRVEPRLPGGVNIAWAGSVSGDVNDSALDATVFAITRTYSVNLKYMSGDISYEVRKIVHNALTNTRYANQEDEIISRIDTDLPAALLEETVSRAEQWNSAHDGYLAERGDYLAAKNRYDKEDAAYRKELGEYNKELAAYQSGLKEYSDSAAVLEESRAELEYGETQYRDGMAQYENGLEQLQQLKTDAMNLELCRWTVLDARCNPGYLLAKNTARNMLILVLFFAPLLILLGAPLIYAAAARTTDRRRIRAAADAATGFPGSEVISKYVFFGISAVLLGTLLGTALGYFVIQKISLASHETFFVTGHIPKKFDFPLTAVVFAAGPAAAFLSVMPVCAGPSAQQAAGPMRDGTPGETEKDPPPETERSPLYSRLAARINCGGMRSNFRLTAVTAICAAGCCMLSVIGFTVKNGIDTAIENQYGNIFKFDHAVTFSSKASETAGEDIQWLLDYRGIEYSRTRCGPMNFKAGEEITEGLLICADSGELTLSVGMTDPGTGEPVVPEDRGVYITRRTSVFYNIHPGDTVILYDERMAPYEAEVAGIFQNYLTACLIMTDGAYREIFGKEPELNCFMLRGCPDAGTLSDELMSTAGFVSITDTADLYDSSVKAASALRLITAVLIFAAGVTVFIALLNLAAVYVSRKKRETAVMRRNGFTVKEAVLYAARESALTVLTGIILGIAAGAVSGYAILRFLEQRNTGFYLMPGVSSWLKSAGLTALCSVIAYAAALRKFIYLRLFSDKPEN